ncbi:hypothetical protein Salat_0623600 [Sesamum alatum]|uniref:Uncharacterized protein n=1 Tax=Sesamum alatum TaxID=300844 RepID=A0AAE1YS18_9LAMI|nr:hypothetical protein Salat_0623600 [Sesamum alatum]
MSQPLVATCSLENSLLIRSAQSPPPPNSVDSSPPPYIEENPISNSTAEDEDFTCFNIALSWALRIRPFLKTHAMIGLLIWVAQYLEHTCRPKRLTKPSLLVKLT